MVAQVHRADGRSGGCGVSDKLPLVVYNKDGERQVIGEATVERVDETGIFMSGKITSPKYEELLKDESRSFSFAPVGFWEH